MDQTLVRVFQRQVLTQCQFIILSVTEMNKLIADTDLTGDEKGLRLFLHIQSILTAVANISKALWGQKGRKTSERELLRQTIGITDNSPLKQVQMRNNFDHFDDRLDEWWTKSPDRKYIDLWICPPGTITAPGATERLNVFRVYDAEAGILTFWGQEFSLHNIVAEINRIYKLLLNEATKSL